jgi:hypothetical protein
MPFSNYHATQTFFAKSAKSTTLFLGLIQMKQANASLRILY